ncbi:Transcriptional regulator, TetR family protein [Minicystis rosea]|nr:Transcriptional regulator, TetR family protein [Minicystis rosea]
MGAKVRASTYGGRSTEERQAERRTRLIEAALDIWGEEGWAAVTMRRVCTRAGLIDRYFYESFSDRDALLVAVWDELRDGASELIRQAVAETAAQPPAAQIRTAIGAVVRAAMVDPKRAHIAFGDHAGSEVLAYRRRDSLQKLTDLMVEIYHPSFRPDVDERALRMTLVMAIGGLDELMTAWHAGLVEGSVDDVIEHAATVAALLIHKYLDPRMQPSAPDPGPRKKREREPTEDKNAARPRADMTAANTPRKPRAGARGNVKKAAKKR